MGNGGWTVPNDLGCDSTCQPQVSSSPNRMLQQSSFRCLAIGSTVALMAAAPTAQAQVSRDWSVCFGSGVSSCTDFYLTTAATLGGFGGARDGTLLSLVLRQRDRGVPTGLSGFSLGFDPGATNAIDWLSTTPTPVGGAQASAPGLGWTLGVYRSTSPSGFNVLFGSGESDLSQTPSPTSWIGGCLSPSSNAMWSVNNVACGSGQGFSFQWNTSAFFDADEVTTVQVDVLSIDQQAGGGTCYGPATGGAGVGYDGYDPSNAFPCDIGRADPLDTTAVPEPQSLVLLAGALAILGLPRLRRRAV